MTQETIIKSFKHAGITTALDGSEDLLMKCLAENDDLARDVQQQLYDGENSERHLLYPSEEQRDITGELCLSDESGDEFCGFDADSFLG